MVARTSAASALRPFSFAKRRHGRSLSANFSSTRRVSLRSASSAARSRSFFASPPSATVASEQSAPSAIPRKIRLTASLLLLLRDLVRVLLEEPDRRLVELLGLLDHREPRRAVE